MAFQKHVFLIFLVLSFVMIHQFSGVNGDPCQMAGACKTHEECLQNCNQIGLGNRPYKAYCSHYGGGTNICMCCNS
ncbi:hypothetical protein RND81_14G008900 [Saponaria officinalis]|uniref:Uncharacterized protein n=1 Tax=Saponaria officinalis TaxID=3572 RepID=A0AAW1GSS4_SAPOF